MQRLSISSTPTCSNAGPDDLESLGDLYVWGELWPDGDASVNPLSSKVDILVPKPLETDVVLDVHQISCGVRHISLVTRQGEVFTWGEELGGRLGHGIERDLRQPSLVEFLAVTNVDFVACGEYHTCAISTSGDLFTWGDGSHNAGLLGQGTDASHWIPKRVSGPLDGLQVLMISCGVWHSAMITTSGRLFTFGDGKFGVLGHGNRESVLHPKEVQQLSKLKTLKVACGVWHTAAIVEVANTPGPNANLSSRKLFTWGDGDKYRLGHENKEAYLLPTCVSALMDYNFHQIACGHTMTVALTTSGHVFTMGGNSFGQLGNPSAEGKQPCLVKDKLVGEFVEEIACGANHVAVLTSRSEIFTWGKGANGRLGHGDLEDRKSPTLVEALKDRHVKSITCGSTFTSSICIHKWVSGSDQSVCSGCRQAFGFTRKRHNCYNCGLVHCHACSSKKALKAALAPTPNKPHRVCDACYNKLKSSGVGVGVGVGAGSNFSKRVTGPRRSVDLTREKFDKEERSAMILPTPSTEPVKYLEVRSRKSGAGTESVSIIRASQVPTFQQMKDVSFPSSLSTLQNNIKHLSSVPPAPMLPANTLSSKNTKRFGPPAPLTSRATIDSLKRSNEVLTGEVSKLQNQIKTLRDKCKAQNKENQNLLQHAKEATTLASKQSSRSKMAEEVITLVTFQLQVLAEKLPPDIYASSGFKTMKKQAESFLEGKTTATSRHQFDYIKAPSMPDDSDKSRNSGVRGIQRDSESDSNETTTSLRRNNIDPVDHSDPSRARPTPQNYESTSNDNTGPPAIDTSEPVSRSEQDGNRVEHDEQDTSTTPAVENKETINSQGVDTRMPKTSVRIERTTEVTEQFEPGVYVTLVQLRSGARFFKRVRFSKRKFSEHNAEEWWKGNKDRVLQRYPPPQPSRPSGQLEDPTPSPPHNEETTST